MTVLQIVAVVTTGAILAGLIPLLGGFLIVRRLSRPPRLDPTPQATSLPLPQPTQELIAEVRDTADLVRRVTQRQADLETLVERRFQTLAGVVNGRKGGRPRRQSAAEEEEEVEVYDLIHDGSSLPDPSSPDPSAGHLPRLRPSPHQQLQLLVAAQAAAATSAATPPAGGSSRNGSRPGLVRKP